MAPRATQVNLQIKGGGIIDDLLNGSGQGTRLTVVGEVPHRTVLTGSVKKAPGGGGRDYIGPTIYGLGQFGDVRVRMYSPPFLVGQYPFMPGSSTAHTALAPVRAAKAVAKTTSRKTARPAVQATATGIATRAGQTGAAILAPSRSIGKSMHRPFHSFR